MTDSYVIELTEDNFEQEIMKSDTPALVDFWAPWCGPCRAVGPFVEAISRSYKGKLKVGKLNIDDHEGVARRFGICSIPTITFFKEGQIVAQIIGSANKPKIEAAVRNVIQ